MDQTIKITHVDFVERELCVGDTIAYAAMNAGSTSLRIGRITKLGKSVVDHKLWTLDGKYEVCKIPTLVIDMLKYVSFDQRGWVRGSNRVTLQSSFDRDRSRFYFPHVCKMDEGAEYGKLNATAKDRGY